MTVNNIEKIHEKLDMLLEKVSKIEIHIENLKSEIKTTKSKLDDHEKDINKVKGAILVASLLGLYGTIKTFLHLP